MLAVTTSRGDLSIGLTGRPRTFPLLRQLREDPLGLGRAAQSRRTEELRPRTEQADRVVRSICPYCAVGCGQLVYVRGEQVIQIEGDPDSPISRGRLCPKGSASKQLVTTGVIPSGARNLLCSLDRLTFHIQ